MGPRAGLHDVYIEKYQHGDSEMESIVRISSTVITKVKNERESFCSVYELSLLSYSCYKISKNILSEEEYWH
jgi:hypothetical protein